MNDGSVRMILHVSDNNDLKIINIFFFKHERKKYFNKLGYKHFSDEYIDHVYCIK